MKKSIALASMLAIPLAGCLPDKASTSGNTAAAVTDGLTAAEACSSKKTRDGLVRVLAEHVPGDENDKHRAFAEFRPLVAFDMTTVDAVDAQTGALTCSSNLRMHAGDVAPYVPIPAGISARQDGRDIVVRVAYRLNALADGPGSMLTLTDDDALSQLIFGVEAVREGRRQVLDDPANSPERYSDVDSLPVASGGNDSAEPGANQSE